MKYFLDTEFHEHSYNILVNGGTFEANTIDLISIALVREDGKSLYLISSEFDVKRAFENEWLKENVLSQIFKELTVKFGGASEFKFELPDFEFLLQRYGISRASIASQIIEFVCEDSDPQFYADYAAYDWVAFCWLFGRMADLPKGFPMFCRDLRQMIEETARRFDTTVEAIDEAIKAHPMSLNQESLHNALADARWNRQLFNFLDGYAMLVGADSDAGYRGKTESEIEAHGIHGQELG